MKNIIINADDFGYTAGVNQGIIECIENGIVTSTSVMIDRPYAHDISSLDKYSHVSVGLHFEMQDGIDDFKYSFTRQLDLFGKYTNRKPDHIDFHKIDIEKYQELKLLLLEYGKQNGIPLRGIDAQKISSFFGIPSEQSISEEACIEILQNAKEGTSEIICHVGYSDDELRNLSSYNDLREMELATLTSGRVKEYIESNASIKLISWKDI